MDEPSGNEIVYDASMFGFTGTVNGDTDFGERTDMAASITNTWEGDEDASWDNPNNWSTGAVPNNTQTVVVPDVSTLGHAPVNDILTTVNKLTILDGGTLTIQS